MASQLYIYHDSCSFFWFSSSPSQTSENNSFLPLLHCILGPSSPTKQTTATFASWTRSTTVLFFCLYQNPTLSSSLDFGSLLAAASAYYYGRKESLKGLKSNYATPTLTSKQRIPLARYTTPHYIHQTSRGHDSASPLLLFASFFELSSRKKKVKPKSAIFFSS